MGKAVSERVARVHSAKPCSAKCVAVVEPEWRLLMFDEEKKIELMYFVSCNSKKPTTPAGTHVSYAYTLHE
jgi:hypothetical protein